MAQVPTSNGIPFATPAPTPPQDYQHIDATPADFGGLLAQGGERLGQGTINAAKFYNEAAINDQISKFSSGLQDITWGTDQEKGVLQLQGADALGALPAAKEKAMALRDSMLENAQNDEQRTAFLRGSQYYLNREIDRMDSHVDTQTLAYARDSANANITRSAQMAASDPTNIDGSVREAYIFGAQAARTHSGQSADPVIAQVSQTAAAGRVVYSALDAMAVKNPVAARQLLDNGTVPGPDGKSRIPISTVLDQDAKFQLEAKINTASDQVMGSAAATTAFRGARGSNTGPVADTTLPTEAQRLLPALSGGEGNYNSPAPKGDASGTPIGNNRYQFLNTTWQGAAPKAGVDVNDHSPAAQDRVAWNHAQDVYKSATGGNLQADLAQGGHEREIALALNKVWPSLPGGSEQNTDMATWVSRLQAQAPTLNNARGPIPGDARRDAINSVLNDGALKGQAQVHALNVLNQLFRQDDEAAHANAEASFNNWVTKIMTNPGSVNPTDLANDPMMTGEQKENLQRTLNVHQTGDGVPYNTALQNVFSPAGSPGRINTVSDIFPLMNQGLTAQGANKLHEMIKLRDQPDGPVMAAAIPAWKLAIENTTTENPSFKQPVTPASAAAFARFTAAMPGIIADARAKGMSMADIVSTNGPIAKVIPTFVPTQAERMRSLGSAAPPAPGQAGTGSSLAPSLTVGQWYGRGPGGAFVPATPGAAGARMYKGGPATGNPASWDIPVATAPQ